MPHCYAANHIKSRHTHTATMQTYTHTDTESRPGAPLRGLSTSCLAVTVACCARERGKWGWSVLLRNPLRTVAESLDDTHYTQTHKLTKGWVWISALCLFVWIPDTGCHAANANANPDANQSVYVDVCICVCVPGQEKTDGYNAHTSGVCLIGEQTSRLACIHTAGCNACTNTHTHTSLAHVCTLI